MTSLAPSLSLSIDVIKGLPLFSNENFESDENVFFSGNLIFRFVILLFFLVSKGHFHISTEIMNIERIFMVFMYRFHVDL